MSKIVEVVLVTPEQLQQLKDDVQWVSPSKEEPAEVPKGGFGFFSGVAVIPRQEPRMNRAARRRKR